MEIKIIRDLLEKFNPRTKQDEENALREVIQQFALWSLSRTDFFKHACFIGGSCLRIAYQLPRFSEDLDFWTYHPRSDFVWQPYLKAVQTDFKAFGIEMEIVDRANADAHIKRAFLKNNSIGKELVLTSSRAFANKKILKVKFEIDVNPPVGGQFESKNIDFLHSYPISVLDKPSLFASKVAALFDREREKGRHWYDFTWYVFQKWPINFQLLGNCLHVTPQEITLNWLQDQLVQLIESISWEALKKDVSPLISLEEQESLEAWDRHFFLGYVEGLEYLNPPPISLGILIADGKGKNLIEKVKEALEAGALANDDTRNGHRPLQLALSKGHRNIAQMLIEHGADVQHRDRSGLTPLQSAVNHGEFEIAKLLIENGAPFNPHAPNLGFVYEKLYQFFQTF